MIAGFIKQNIDLEKLLEEKGQSEKPVAILS
jgi:hypothetical protein